MRDWYCLIGGYKYGPVTDATLLRWVWQGRLQQGHFLWTAGLPAWMPGCRIPGLFEPVGVSRKGHWMPPIAPAGGTAGISTLGQIFSNARWALKGRWGRSVAFCLVLSLLVDGASMVLALPTLGLAGLAKLMLGGAFALGEALYFLALTRRGEPRLGMMFWGFPRFKRGLMLFLLRGILSALWGIGGVAAGVGAIQAFEHDKVLLGRWLLVPLAVLGLPGFIAYLQYTLVFFILADHPNLGPMGVFRRNRYLLQGNRLKLLRLWAPFLAIYAVCWSPMLMGFAGEDELAAGIVLGFFIYTTARLFLRPFASTALACFYQDLREPRQEQAGSRPSEVVQVWQAPQPYSYGFGHGYRQGYGNGYGHGYGQSPYVYPTPVPTRGWQNGYAGSFPSPGTAPADHGGYPYTPPAPNPPRPTPAPASPPSPVPPRPYRPFPRVGPVPSPDGPAEANLPDPNRTPPPSDDPDPTTPGPGPVPDRSDVIVSGGGHAGAEAAHAAARLGARTALITQTPAAIAQMSCNPAVGGIGKGQIVREIDAMGGLMGLAADATGIQFRMLNLRKGPAVWGPRCQSDRHAYAAFIQQLLAETPGLDVLAGEVVEVVHRDGRARGVRYVPVPNELPSEGIPLAQELSRARGRGNADGERAELACEAVIVTAGTFLGGLMHLGEQTWTGGRYGERASAGLTASLVSAGLRADRLKTGTCPRIDATTIDYDRCICQDGNRPPQPFSFMNDRLSVEQVPCWITHTSERLHQLVRANLSRAPLFTGQIQATGPRYCPSFETKIVRFADKSSHQLFLEPEGRDTNWVYVNGLATSLPVDVQDELVHGVAGLENARVIRWGYAIEYDYFPPTQLTADLQAKCLQGLYLAGQVNGTTGYEEAAGQGVLAGINAARSLAGADPQVLRRDQAYIGVMIDDLVTKGVAEPYRMFTSRAEHRLSLRADNADRRLTPLAREVGTVDESRWRRFQDKRADVERIGAHLDNARLQGRTLRSWLRGGDVPISQLASQMEGQAGQELREICERRPAAAAAVEIDVRYEGYLDRQERALAQMTQLDRKRIPANLDYSEISQLRHEARERLAAIRPANLGQALRVPGITPADISVLSVVLQVIQGAEGVR